MSPPVQPHLLLIKAVLTGEERDELLRALRRQRPAEVIELVARCRAESLASAVDAVAAEPEWSGDQEQDALLDQRIEREEAAVALTEWLLREVELHVREGRLEHAAALVERYAHYPHTFTRRETRIQFERLNPMKFVVDRDPFLEALQRVAKVAQRGKVLIPILSHVRIDAGQRRLKIVANDSSRELAVELPADIAKQGATTVNARALLDFVSNGAGGEQVELEGAARAGDRITVRAGQAKALLFTLPATDFPVFSGGDPDHTVTIEGPALAGALAAVAYAQAGTTDQREFLKGIYLHRHETRSLVAVSTDGHRLSRVIVDTGAELPDFPGTIVPTPSVEHARALAERADTVEIGISETLLRFVAEGTVFTTKLIDGTYPDYTRVVPDAPDKGFDISRESLLRAVKRCSAIVAEKGKPLKLSPADGTLSLLGRGDEMGEISDVVEADTTTKIPIGFNAGYLAATLDAMEGETVQVRYADAGAPVVFTDPTDPARLQILMPMRV